jgi:HEAT repeat protein
MASLGGETGEKGLRAALSDREYQVRIHALRCIEELGLVSLRPVLEEMVEGRDFQARNLYEKQEVFRTIARLGGEDAIPFLDRMIEKRGLFRKSVSEEVRVSATSALGWIPGGTAKERLLHLARHGSKAVREAAEIAIRRIRGDAAAAKEDA